MERDWESLGDARSIRIIEGRYDRGGGMIERRDD
jgi:hypothetical protein